MSLIRKYRNLGWDVVYNHSTGQWRGVRNNAATDDDVTGYYQTRLEAWYAIRDHVNSIKSRKSRDAKNLSRASNRHKGERVRVTLRLPVELHKWLNDIAQQDGKSLNDLLVDHLAGYMQSAKN